MALRLLALASAVALAACSSSTTTTPFGPSDGGGTGNDSGGNSPDSGNPTDSGSPPVDSGGGMNDAGMSMDSGGGDDGGDSYDFGCGGNTACPLTQVCCSNPGGTPPFSCTDKASCSAGDQITCDGPDECGGATPLCCGVETTNGQGTYPQCTPASISSTCKAAADCAYHLGSSCTDTTKVVICHSAATDCTQAVTGDSKHNQCCTFKVGTGNLTFCTDSLTATGASACHP